MSYVTAFKTTAFNPPSISPGAILGPYDREISGPISPATGSYGVLGVNSIANTQKKYMEFTIGAASSAGALVGFGSTSLSGTTNLGVNSLGVALDGVSGDVLCNGVAIATPGITFTAGDVVCLAIDRPNNVFWFRKNGGNWNGNGAADPTTNTGGITIPSTVGTGNLYLAAVAKVASSTTSKISINLGHTAFAQTRPTGFLVWTGLTDSAYIQNLINAAAADRTNIVVLPVARYDCRSQIVLPRGMTLQGSGHQHHPLPGFMTLFNDSTVLDINWGSGAGSSGDETKAAIIQRAGTAVRGIAFNYDGQDPTAAPVEWGSTVQIADDTIGQWGQEVSGCWFHKSYIAIDYRGSLVPGGGGVAGLKIEGNKGSPLHTGIWLEGMSDWATVKDNHFNSGFCDDPTISPYRTLKAWVHNNGVAMRVDGNDWVRVDGMRAWGYRTGIQVRARTGHVSDGPFTIYNSDLDACQTGVHLTSVAYYFCNVRIDNCTFACMNVVTGTKGYPLFIDPGAGGVGVSFTNNYAGGFNEGIILAAGTVFGLFTVHNNQADQGAGGVALQLGTPGAVYIEGNRFGGFI